MYKVFFNDRTLFLTDNQAVACKERSGLLLRYVEPDVLQETVKFFSEAKHVSLMHVYHFDIDKLRLDFRQCFKNIDAAGGVVKNAAGEYLLIFRRGKWDLPKGKVDKGEEYPDAALREVTEETGLKNIKIESPLMSTYHTYPLKKNIVLKKTYWFQMDFSGDEPLVPQKEEDIEEARWFKPSELHEAFENTYPLIIDLFMYIGIIV